MARYPVLNPIRRRGQRIISGVVDLDAAEAFIENQDITLEEVTL